MNGSSPGIASLVPRSRDVDVESLRRTGFARGPAADFGIAVDGHEEDFRQIATAFVDLPPDPYDPGSNRFRRYSQLVYLPWNDGLFWIPGIPDAVHSSIAEYYQDGYNPEYPQLRRRFPDLPAELQANPLLLEIIRADIERVLWLEEFTRGPLYVGVHMIKLAVRNPGEQAVTSPNCLHQDGGATMFTFAHLVNCRNVVGGENVIATPDSAGRQPEELQPDAVHARFTLAEPLETYVVHDNRVSHYVSPVRLGELPGHGERSILILGLAPFIPRL